MITPNGDLRCDGCGKKLGDNLEGKLEIVCPRCNKFNKFDSAKAFDMSKKCGIIRTG